MRRSPLIVSGAAALLGAVLMFSPLGAARAGFKVEEVKPAQPKTRAELQAEADRKLPQDHDYVVHEWGTFTSFSGSDGIALEFRPLVDEDLPAFVIDRPRQDALNHRRDVAYARGYSDPENRFVKANTLSKQRMETPVTYFYADKERIVDAWVEFPQGLLTEFYPPVRQFGPAYQKDVRAPLEGSWLRWGKVRLLPEARAVNKNGADPLIRDLKPNENPHYAYARETDSAHVQLTDPATDSVYREKFLFYRGVGNFKLPVRVEATGGGHFTLTYSGTTPLHYAFLVLINDGKVRFAQYDGIADTVKMTLPGESSSLDDLSRRMELALVSDGLFEKEAKAMVKTWRSSWFGEEGTRVLYSVPQGQTDTLLPLHLSPTPKELVRVMIGRLETLTPEQEASIEALVTHLGDDNPAARDQTSKRIMGMGRFAEPALTRVVAKTTDPEVKVRAEGLLKVIAEKRVAK
jgi:hypothetical protein